jgi:hypothetical protein
LSLKKTSSLKRMRQQATDPNKFLITCPACGMTLERGQVPQHHLICKAWEAAESDSKKKGMTQADFVRMKQSYSQHFAWVLDADFTRRHWLWMALSYALLCFGIGWISPQSSIFLVNILLVPALLVAAVLGFFFLDKRGRIRK